MNETRTSRETSLYAGLIVACAIATIAPLCFSAQFSTFADSLIVHADRGHMMLPAAILFFTLASFLGAPQPLLVGACVLAVGAERGFLYGWIATVAAAIADYSVAHFAQRYARRRVDGLARSRIMRTMRQRPFLASFLIRNIPSAPFVVVNMAFGLARADFWRFGLGLVLGVAPKTALVAFGFKAVMAAIAGNATTAVFAAAAAIGLALLGVMLSRHVIGQRSEMPGSAD